MIDTALILLRDELSSYITLKDASVNVVIDNIGLVETSNGETLTNNVVITLVNIEEESTLKNQPALKRPFINNKGTYQNPPVYLNLYVLFVSNYSGNDYPLALKRLSYIIQFLQGKNSFSSSSSVSGSLDLSNDNVTDLKFTLELYTLTFEQINHLWGSLGGRQMPFVMYKLRLVAITEGLTLREVPLVEEIDTIISKI
jgi:hypothetical protein